LVVLGVLSVIALGLRLWNLDSDLWHDEVGTLLNFVRPPLGEIVTSFPNQNQHLLYSILAWVSVETFGESAWAIRLPAVLFGVASLWALFLLGRRIVGATEALLACALMTFSYHHVWFSQNARGYTGLLLFTLLGTWLWLEAISRGELRWWVLYALAVILGLLTHLTMAFVVAAQVMLYLFQLVRDAGRSEVRVGWKPVVTWVLCATATLQLYALSLPEFLQKGLHEVSQPSEWTNPMWVVTETIRNLQFGLSGAAVLLGGGALVLIGWLSILRRDYRAGMLMVLPAVFVAATMLVLGHNLWPRFFFFSMGFGLLIVVRGAVAAPGLLLSQIGALRLRLRLAPSIGTGLACLIIAASAVTVPRNYSLPKQNFTGARDYVETNRKPGDAVVAVGLAGVDYGRYFAPHWSVAQTEAELDAIRRSRPTTWLIYTLPIQVKARLPELWNTIQNDFQVVKVFPGTLNDGEVYVCQHSAPEVAIAR
jgi:4-amino-4-deoxy-L-arabinose transferase-like glycosyltransferase